MRQLLVVLLVLGFGFAANAQTNATPAAPASTDATAPAAAPTEPLSTTSADNTRYLANPSS